MTQKQYQEPHYLSKRDRQKLMWTETESRRQTLPSYASSLVNVNTRMRCCDTCGKMFLSAEDLKKHTDLNHTGAKPVVCHFCGKRFWNQSQMTSHYKIHKEARLEEFENLMKRQEQDLASSQSDSSKTTVGSFHHIPKVVKDYVSESSASGYTFGTNQTFNAKPINNQLNKHRNQTFCLKHDATFQLPSITPKVSNKRVRNTPRNVANKENTFAPHARKLPPIQKVPRLDPGNISVIDSVMGVSKAIDTGEKSKFTEREEERLIKSRIEAIALASRPSTRQSRTREVTPDPRKSTFTYGEFQDVGSHVTRRNSDMSGYYQNHLEISSPKLQKSVFSLPRLQ